MSHRVLVHAAALLALVAASPAAETKPKKPAAPAPLILAEDFEGTAAGQIPKGYTKSGSVGVDDQVAHSGTHSLRLDAAPSGARCLTVKDPIVTALGGEHWGRLFFKVKLPVPTPHGDGKFPVIHSSLVYGSAQSPSAMDPIEVRLLGIVLGPNDGAFQYLYNVQPRKRPEFASGSTYDYHFSDAWTMAEWHVDYATQSYQLFIDGEEIVGPGFAKGAGVFEKAEIPAVFESLSFGWCNYQKADPGFTAWIDDLALSKDRVGDRGLPPPAKAKRGAKPAAGAK
jgi:hypothetical protein